MGSIVSCNPDLFRESLMKAEHNLGVGGHTFKVGLFKSLASLTGNYNKNTEKYSDITGNSDENAGVGYTAGGIALTNVDPVHDSTNHVAYNDFSNEPTWAASTISARGSFIYNDSHVDKEIFLLHDFGSDKNTSAGAFKIVFPPAAHNTAIFQLA